ncbi:AAA+ superfamily ATPase [Nanobdella aerobiophila]|uniref:AAA+ superfamily ATPase n=1 Tax=Nanobdella aerobiophila TaxID=2586965 RepID=A0A915SA51_9ARCH|nr:AAA+ superfamily ATPase [Nanobdella aerobiophila]
MNKNIDPKRILYLSFDEYKDIELYELLDIYTKITNIDWRKEKIYIFLDEIQKLKDWSSKIKFIYDNFTNIKIFLSGSSSLLIEKNAIENLAGRYFIFELPVLNIKEYYELKNNKILENYNLEKRNLELEFNNYLYKPFPEIVNFNIEDSRQYIKEIIISKIIKGDILDIFGNIDINNLEKLLYLFLSKPGMILNLDNLSGDLNMSKKTLEKYIKILEFSKLIKILKNFRPSTLSSSRKLRKVYPYDVSLSLSLFNVDESISFETKIINYLDCQYYWRKNNKEIDCILLKENNIIPIEIKYKNNIKDNDIKNLKYFLNKYNIKNDYVIYLGESTKIDNINLVNYLDLLYYGLEGIFGYHL